MQSKRFEQLFAVVALAVCVDGTRVVAQTGYDKPPQYILDVMHAPSPPVPVVSPTKDRMLLVSWQQYPSIGRVAMPYLGLAGVRVEPRSNRKENLAVTLCIV